MKEISAFVDRALVQVPKCPFPVAEIAVRDALNTFCEETWILKVGFPFEIAAADIDTDLNNSVDVDVSFRDDVEPLALSNLYVGGIEVPARMMEVADHAENFESIFSYSNKVFFFKDATTITIFPFQPDDYKLFLVVPFQFLETATEVDDQFWTRWRAGVVARSVSELKAQSGRAWYDQAGSDKAQRDYLGIRDRAKLLSMNFFRPNSVLMVDIPRN